ncbi:kelch domain-containing protein 7A [Bombina bombina]|uniref:kelch domain-containing protein 7A n=1 Tax=Bombina bombina TaxID=8345 RepID=UPI00235AB48F|nr:kelch domain-containing protein 7A [Bombina bombina]
MINIGLESRFWQLDMQLAGKLAVSATALVLLGLAYRFYKSRILQRGESHKQNEDFETREEDAALFVPKWNHLGDESAAVRLRNVNNNIRRSVDGDSGTRSNGSGVLDTTELSKTSENNKNKVSESNIDVSCEQQHYFKNAALEESNEVPDLPQRYCPTIKTVHHNNTEGPDFKEDISDGNWVPSGSTVEIIRHSPEGKEMSEDGDTLKDKGFLKEVTKNVSANSSIDFSIEQNSKDMHGLHSFSSVTEVQVEESIIKDKLAEDANTPQKQTHGYVRGKIYDYHVESTSESVTTNRNYKYVKLNSDSSQSSLTANMQQITEQEDRVSFTVQSEVSVDGPMDISLKQVDLSPSTKEESLEARPEGSDYIPMVTESSTCRLENSATCTNTFHMSINSGSTFDIHLDVGNCYEVLCLAKKHKLDILQTAAYKIMSNDYLQILQNPSIYGRLNATERDLILDNRMRGRRVVAIADIDTQHYSSSQNKSSLSYYDSDKDLWLQLSNIPGEAVSRGCAMATMFNYLFVALGCEGPGREMKPSKRVFCYNPFSDNWKEICPLNEARPHCKLVALDGHLYAIGGECLHTVECYDPRHNKWSYVAPLPNDTFAVAHMATACEDGIYVTGGTIRYMLLRYHEKDKMWKSSIISGSKDRTTEMVAVNNFLYRFDLNRNTGISVHRCSVRARIWYECANYPMPYPSSFQCAVIDKNIYCISRTFHLRFLADDISPRFMDGTLTIPSSPKGALFPFVLVIPDKEPQKIY